MPAGSGTYMVGPSRYLVKREHVFWEPAGGVAQVLLNEMVSQFTNAQPKTRHLAVKGGEVHSSGQISQISRILAGGTG